MFEYVELVWAHKTEILAAVGAIVLAASALVKALQAASHSFDKFARLTATKEDDKLAATLVKVADFLAAGVDKFVGLIQPLSLFGRGRK